MAYLRISFCSSFHHVSLFQRVTSKVCSTQASWTAGRNIPLTRNNAMFLHKREQGELVAVGREAGPQPAPDQQFRDEHVPQSQCKTFH